MMGTTDRARSARFAVAFLLLWAGASPAFAAPAPAALDSLSMQVQTSSSAVLVSGRLASSVTLPATLSLPIPSGATPYWVGEIVGTDPSKDPRATYKIEKEDGYDLVVFTIKQGRTGQVELSLPAAVAGAPSTLSYSLPVVSKVAEAKLTFGLPSGAAISTSTAGLVGGQGTSGEPVFARAVKNPKVGSVIKESLTYSLAGLAGGAGVSGATATYGGSAADGMAVPLWIIVLVLAGLFARSVYRDRRAAVEADTGNGRADDSAFDNDEPASAKKAVATRRTAAPPASGPAARRTPSTNRAGRPQDA